MCCCSGKVTYMWDHQHKIIVQEAGEEEEVAENHLCVNHWLQLMYLSFHEVTALDSFVFLRLHCCYVAASLVTRPGRGQCWLATVNNLVRASNHFAHVTTLLLSLSLLLARPRVCCLETFDCRPKSTWVESIQVESWKYFHSIIRCIVRLSAANSSSCSECELAYFSFQPK